MKEEFVDVGPSFDDGGQFGTDHVCICSSVVIYLTLNGLILRITMVPSRENSRCIVLTPISVFPYNSVHVVLSISPIHKPFYITPTTNQNHSGWSVSV